MIELFAELIARRRKMDFPALIEQSMKNDTYLRDNVPMKVAYEEDLHGSELFYRIDDDHAHIKKEVYFSYFVHKILLSMKRFYKIQERSHVVLVCDNESDMMHILEEQIFRIISQIEDAEYRVTEKSPISFIGKHTTRREEKQGYRLVELTLPRCGVISLIVFYPVFGSRGTDTSIIQNLLEDMHQEDVTHFYKLDSAFNERRVGARGEIVETYNRILEESMPKDCIHYTFISKRSTSNDSYASRNGERFVLQLNEKNFSLMSELIKGMYTSNSVNVLEDGYIRDPISSPYENLKLCKVDRYTSILEDMNENRMSESASIGSSRGQRMPSLWIDETRVPSYVLGADTSRHNAQSITMMNTQIQPMLRYDADGDTAPIRYSLTNSYDEMREARNQRTYSFDTVQEAIRNFSEDQARRMDQSIFDEFLRNWIDE